MARSVLILAASVTAALPRAVAVGAGVLTENTTGRYDCALVRLDDERDVVVRVSTDDVAARELDAEVRALRALTAGVRAILPFRVPELLGETDLVDGRAAVVDYLPGYRTDAAELPAGPGAAPSIGTALAAIHALPPAVLRASDLPARSPAQQRHDLSQLLDRLDAAGRVPVTLLDRWRRAVDEDALWRFESAVVLGGADAASFLLEDDDVTGPRVCGVLEWGGLSLGDPAIDLRWLASAPVAADDVHAAYAAHSQRAPDVGLRARARLHAELEFARWLLHGIDSDRPDVVTDAVALLTSLADGVRSDDLFTQDELDLDDAIALLERTPSAQAPDVDTSMQTDAYDPGTLSMFVSDPADSTDDQAAEPAAEDVSTAPIDISAWSAARAPDDDAGDDDRASRAALQRWASSSWE